MDNQVEFNEISKNTQTEELTEEAFTEVDEEVTVQDETDSSSNKKSLPILIICMAAVFIMIVIGSFAAAEDSVDGKETGIQKVDFVHDYDSEDEINIQGNTSSNYNNGAWVAGQGRWTYCIVSNQIIKFSDGSLQLNKQLVWSGTNGDDIKRLSVCGDYLYFVSDSGLCRVRTDGMEYEVLLEDSTPFIHSKYVVYDQKIYTSMSLQISATEFSDYFIEYDCNDRTINEIPGVSDYEFIGADSGYLVFDMGKDTDDLYKMLLYKISDGTMNKVEIESGKVSFFLSDGNLYCLSSGWFGSYSLQNIQVIDLETKKTVRHINPDVGISAKALNFNEGEEEIIIGDTDGIGRINMDDDYDYSRWFVFNKDPATNICAYENDFYYKCNEGYYRTSYGNASWGEITTMIP